MKMLLQGLIHKCDLKKIGFSKKYLFPETCICSMYLDIKMVRISEYLLHSNVSGKLFIHL